MSDFCFSDPKPLPARRRWESDADVIILGGGFEERAERYVTKAAFRPGAICVLVRFDASISGNQETYSRYCSLASSKFSDDQLRIIDLVAGHYREFERQLEHTLLTMPASHRNIWIDVSGLPSHIICSTLRIVRALRPLEEQTIVYTAAVDYNPTQNEYDELKAKAATSDKPLEFLPRSMALEMGENYIPDGFSGHRTNDRRTALAVFAGYEVHRSIGVIDNINPSILLLLFGQPGDEGLSWRLDLSRELHSRFRKERKCATEVVSTLRISECLAVLETYYDHLYDDFDLTISPVCSKMHTVASFLFWERYKEVQLAFPLPIGYEPQNRPLGVGKTYQLNLRPSRQLYSPRRA